MFNIAKFIALTNMFFTYSTLSTHSVIYLSNHGVTWSIVVALSSELFPSATSSLIIIMKMSSK